MKLRFFARGTHLVSYPRSQREGQRPRYLGREMDAPKAGEHAGAYPATREPFECYTGTPLGARVVHVMAQSAASGDLALWPADEGTARAIGVRFVPTEFIDGEHRAVAATEKPKAAPK